MLTRRELNRALLDRQMLLRRHDAKALAAIEHLVGMQSQAPLPAYVGLWTRLLDFRHEDLAGLLTDRAAVRIALMRGTIHLVSADDCLALRPVMQPLLDRLLRTSYGRRLDGVDLGEVANAARALMEERPLSFAELEELLGQRWPGRDALAQAVRAVVPLVQVPPRGVWGASGQARHVPAESWLGRPLGDGSAAGDMVLRYLRAFGPASVKDMQTWSGLTGLRSVVKGLDLVTYRDENGVELFDLPGAPLPGPDAEAPVRFLPEFDNLLLSHADRTRVMAEEHRLRVFTVNGIIRATILVDGFVAGLWRIERERIERRRTERAGETAVLEIEPFAPLGAATRDALAAEGERLLEFAAGDASARDIRFLG
ncbi:winged helix DNA-binding domain-containing protein [Microbispora sp. GKU 823]|uniref:winged helix DNA-binding domain-containing protein n=1 Tax=Microbispora sp. GKU 823 TaxID=1652100 RepID=UPI002118BF6C|nr:winged helix DNA-binding domain-containing protein [Microbispora sp. GKU 823]